MSYGSITPEPDIDWDALDRARDLEEAGEAEEQPTRRLILTPASQIRIRKVRWLMDKWVLLAGMTLLAGREGLGKSTIAVYIAALLTVGKLDGERYGTPGNVLYVATEDDPGYTVAPRFLAAGADMDRVFFLTVKTAHGDDGRVVLPMDLDDLEAMIVDNNITMIVLDAATSVMDSRLDGHDDRKVRQFLEPVSALAQRTETAILGIVHFGKREGADTGKLILGSVAWSQVARSVLAVALDEDTGNLVITNTKKNLAPETHSASARIVSTTVHTEDGPAEVGRIEWLGETDADARQLLSGPGDDGDDRTEIAAVIQDYLEEQGGSAPVADVLKVTRAAGLSDNAVKKHRKKAGVKTEKAGGTGVGWVWTYTGEDSPKKAKDSKGAHTNAQAPLAPLAPLSGISRAESIAERINQAPQCEVCDRPVTSGQGTTHLGCKEAVA